MSVIDVEQFDVEVLGFQPSTDGSTFVYKCSLKIGDITYPFEKRFSEFHELHNNLFARGYGSLPSPPSKTFTRPNDPASAEVRQHKLNGYLRSLCVRADVRSSEPMAKFLHLDTLENFVPVSLDAHTITNTTDFASFSVVDIAARPPLYVAAMSDTTALSRLGRAWSVIEPDTVGALAIYSLVPNSESGWAFSAVFQRATQKRITIARFIEVQQPLLLVGDSDGLLSIYEYKYDTGNGGATLAGSAGLPAEEGPRERLELAVLSTCEMHIKSPIAQLVCSPINPCKWVSIGTNDQGIRMFCLDRTEYKLQLLGGGRVVKPLREKNEALMSVAFLEGVYSYRGAPGPVRDVCRCVVGTSAGQLLIYDMNGALPNMCGSVNLCKLVKFLSKQACDTDEVGGGYAVTQLRVVETLADGAVVPVLAVGVRGMVAFLSLELIVAPNMAARISQFHQALNALSVPSLASASGAESALQVAVNAWAAPGFIVGADCGSIPNINMNIAESLISGVNNNSNNNNNNNNNSTKAGSCMDSGTAEEIISRVMPMSFANTIDPRLPVTALCVFANRLFVAFQKGISAFDLASGELLVSYVRFRWGTIRALLVSELQGRPVLLAATSVGGLRLVSIADHQHWKNWDAGRPTNPAHYAKQQTHTPSEQSAPPSRNCSAELREDLLEDIYSAFRPAHF